MIAADGPAVADLIRGVEAADAAIHRTGAAEIADMMEGHSGTRLLDTAVGVDAEGHLVAVGTVRVETRVTEMAVAVVNAFIAPHWRGRGLGRSLLYWQDGRARQLLVAHFGADSTVPAAITNIVDSHMTDRRRLYIAGGFHAQRTFAVMYRELEGSETAPAPRDGYTVVPWDQAPLESVRALHMEVFRDHFWPEMRGEWWEEAMAELDPRWSFVALSPRGEPAGYAAVGRPVDRWLAEGRTEAYVSLIGVGRDHRGGGLTSALVGSALEAAAHSGVARIGLDVDTTGVSHAHAIYEHLGFIDDRSQVYYAIEH